MQNKQDYIQLRVTKKNPKPNAPVYEIRTIEELYKALTPENYKRFLADFQTSIEMVFPFKELYEIAAEKVGVKDSAFPVSFTWIDD